MANFGGFYQGDRKKKKKTVLEKKAQKLAARQTFVLPQVEIIKKSKDGE